MTIAYRQAEIEDAPFVASTWSRAFKSSRSAGIIAAEDWASVMAPQIQKLLSRPSVQTIVAMENTDPSFLYGFISADVSSSVPVVFFCYVKEPYRRAGYARGLFAEIGIDPERRFVFTCWTPIVQKLSAKIPLAKHDPNYARIPGYVEEPRRQDRWKR